jgi:exodeoxyribonuclease VII large subunit
VEGEVSNLRRPASGHIYFTLKDSKSQIRAVLFRNPYGTNKKGPPGFDLDEGMSIVCVARLTVYQPRGEYQLVIETIEPRGLGALQKAFEQLKAKLAAEGLFDPERKKGIPFIPGRIGVITSPTGAVIRDILTVTRRRFSAIDILIAPVRVQGSEAPAEIINAIRYLQSIDNVDVIILARGGGSLEDLAPFNDEGVARAIAASRIPIISAVGHETDFTIADFTADLRAATPSAAAELVVPLRTELLENVYTLRKRLIRRFYLDIEQRREDTAGLTKRIKDPRRLLTDARLAVDDYGERLKLSLVRIRENCLREWTGLSHRLKQQNPQSMIKEGRIGLAGRGKDLQAAWEKLFSAGKNRAESASGILSSLNPLAVLGRGYSITRRLPDGRIIRRESDAAIGEKVEILLAEGKLGARITE